MFKVYISCIQSLPAWLMLFVLTTPVSFEYFITMFIILIGVIYLSILSISQISDMNVSETMKIDKQTYINTDNIDYIITYLFFLTAIIIYSNIIPFILLFCISPFFLTKLKGVLYNPVWVVWCGYNYYNVEKGDNVIGIITKKDLVHFEGELTNLKRICDGVFIDIEI